MRKEFSNVASYFNLLFCQLVCLEVNAVSVRSDRVQGLIGNNLDVTGNVVLNIQ